MRLVKQINWIREESEHNKTFHDIIERHNNKFGFKGDLQVGYLYQLTRINFEAHMQCVHLIYVLSSRRTSRPIAAQSTKANMVESGPVLQNSGTCLKV